MTLPSSAARVESACASGGLAVRAGFAEVASGLAAVRDRHGGESIFYHGGGGQGNHLGGGLRFLTNDFGRQDKTFTNFDRFEYGFGVQTHRPETGPAA